jgi:hypothetical protein
VNGKAVFLFRIFLNDDDDYDDKLFPELLNLAAYTVYSVRFLVSMSLTRVVWKCGEVT